MTPEFHRPLPLARITGSEQVFPMEADAAECAALAARMGLVSVRALSCQVRLRRLSGGMAGRAGLDGSVIEAHGRLRAEVVQTCVVSLEPFAVVLEEAFTVHFVPAGTEQTEFDPEAVDEIPLTGGVLDLGEAAAEQLALVLDPYPRKPGATLPSEAADPAPVLPFEPLRRH